MYYGDKKGKNIMIYCTSCKQEVACAAQKYSPAAKYRFNCQCYPAVELESFLGVNDKAAEKHACDLEKTWVIKKLKGCKK